MVSGPFPSELTLSPSPGMLLIRKGALPILPTGGYLLALCPLVSGVWSQAGREQCFSPKGDWSTARAGLSKHLGVPGVCQGLQQLQRGLLPVSSISWALEESHACSSLGLRVWKREGSKGSSQREMLTHGPPARTNGKAFVFPNLKSRKPCCCFLKTVEENCVSAESFLHHPVPLPAVCRGFWKHCHFKVCVMFLGT